MGKSLSLNSRPVYLDLGFCEIGHEGIYTYIYMYLPIYICIFIFICICICIHIHMYMYLSLNSRLVYFETGFCKIGHEGVHTFIHKYEYIYVCINIYICT